MVFYLFFPLILAFCRGSVLRLCVLTVFSTVIALLFINITLRGHQSMLEGNVWESYTQPVAFFGYFSFGCLLSALYVHRPQLKGNVFSFVLIGIGLLPFLLVRTSTTLQLLTGVKGVLLMSGTLLVIAGAAFLPEPRGWLRTLANWLGQMSYSIYLIHLVVWMAVSSWFPLGAMNVVTVIAVTFMLSMIVNRYVEQPFIKLGAIRIARHAKARKASGQY